MAVKALYDYEFPSRDRAELYGEDQLVNVLWLGNPLIATPACFRVPRSTSLAEFKRGFLDPWAATDPTYDPDAATGWELDGKPLEMGADSLEKAGVAHKGLITFRTRP